MPSIRPYRPTDRAGALALLGDPRAIDQLSHRIQVSDDGEGLALPMEGLALWVKPDAGDEAYLGPVLTKVPNRVLFYQLIAACAQEALDEGFKRAYFTISDPRLLARIERDFKVEPEPSGWDPETGKPVQWDIHVDLRDALGQLSGVT